MDRNGNKRFTFSNGLLVGGAVIAGAAYFIKHKRHDAPSPLEEHDGSARRVGPTLAWLVMFTAASAVAIVADRRLKKLRDLLHA